MGLIAALIFIAVFTLIALPLVGSALSPSRSRQALATLDSAIKAESQEMRQQSLNLRKDESLSSIPWLNQRLKKLEIVPYLRRMLSQADLNWSPGRLLALGIALFAIPFYAAYQYWGSMLVALAIGALLGAAPFAFVVFKRKRRFAQFEKILPESLDLMVSGLRAGHSLVAAMALVARECPDPVGSEFRICFEEQNYGLEMNAALDNLTNRVPLQDVKITCHRDHDSKGERRQPGGSAGQDGVCDPGAFPAEAADPGAYGAGAADGLDSDRNADRAGHRNLFR